MRLLLPALLLALGLACSDRPSAPALALAGHSEAGRVVYRLNCAGCHGAEGQGILRAPALAGRVHALPDDEVVHVMLNGRRGMPAKRITDQEAADVLAWMRATWPAASPDPGSGVDGP